MKVIKIQEFPTDSKIVITYEDGTVVTWVPQGSEVPPTPPTIVIPLDTPVILTKAA